jgi:Protein of unknown function (DUF4230)
LGVGKRGGGLGTTLVLALVVVVLAASIGVGLSRYGYRLPVVGWFFEVPVQTTTSPVVVEGIQRLDHLATVRFNESVVITKETGGEGIRQLLTGEKVILVAQGGVEAGVDLSTLDRSDVRVRDRSVSIDLPDPQILSASLNERETRVYDRDMGLMPRINPSDDLVEEARDEAQDRLRNAALEDGILDYAERNAEDSIRAFVTTLGFEEVEFVE